MEHLVKNTVWLNLCLSLVTLCSIRCLDCILKEWSLTGLNTDPGFPSWPFCFCKVFRWICAVTHVSNGFNCFCGAPTEAGRVKMKNFKALRCVGGRSKKGHLMAEQKKPFDLCINDGEDKIAVESFKHSITECSQYVQQEPITNTVLQSLTYC